MVIEKKEKNVVFFFGVDVCGHGIEGSKKSNMILSRSTLSHLTVSEHRTHGSNHWRGIEG